MFKEKAKDWDTNEMVRELSSAIGRCILDNVNLHEQMKVLDFGAGTGLITSQLAPHVHKITAVDVSQSMLERLMAKQEFKEKVEILCQDITTQPTGSHYDLIVSAMAMHHVKDTDNMIKQFAAHLKPGAMVALADLDKEDGSFHPQGIEGVYHDGFERVDFEAGLKKHGCKDINLLTAHTVSKEENAYPIFLAVATRPSK